MSSAKATEASVRAAKERYIDLKAKQRSLPPSEQWTMGFALKEAKVAAYVEIQELAAGIR